MRYCTVWRSHFCSIFMESCDQPQRPAGSNYSSKLTHPYMNKALWSSTRNLLSGIDRRYYKERVFFIISHLSLGIERQWTPCVRDNRALNGLLPKSNRKAWSSFPTVGVRSKGGECSALFLPWPFHNHISRRQSVSASPDAVPEKFTI